MDELFLFNWIMDLLVLMLADLFFRGGKRRRVRLLFGAACGAAGSCLLLVLQLVCGCTWLAKGAAALLAGVLLAVCMTAAAFPVHTVRTLLFQTAAVYAAALLIGGVCGWLRTYMGGAYLFWLTAATIICAVCRRLRMRWQARASTYINARISCGGAVVSVKGIVDTGNSLTLPGTRTPVSVITKQALLPALTDAQAAAYARLCAALSGKQKPDTANGGPETMWRLVPYKSVGRSLGFLPALCVPHIYVRTETNECHLKQIWLAISPSPLFARGGCEMLWHPSHLPQYFRSGGNGIYDCK